MRLLSILASLAMAAGSVACSGQGVPGTAGLPALASLDSRVTSTPEVVAQDGVDAIQRSPGAVEISSSLYLNAATGEMEWGIWQFTPTPGKPLFTLSIALNPGATEEAWLALADFSANKWVMSGPFTAAQIFDLAIAPGVFSPTGNVYIAVVATDGKMATVDSLALELEGNTLPVASFTATPQNGTPGEATILDASASIDPDGTLVFFDWDLDGDGTYEFNSGGPVTNTTLPFPAGTVSVGLRVTDDRGGMGTTTVDIESHGDVWQIVDVDSGSFAYLSMTTVNGVPAIAYHDLAAQSLEYAYAATPDGLNGWNSLTVHNSAASDSVGWHPSLAEINGKPAISYGLSVGGTYTIGYAYSAQPDGSADWTSVDVNFDWGGYTSLAPRPDGTPGITYYSVLGDDLMYVYSTMPDGSSGWNHYGIEIGGSQTGQYTSSDLIGGNSCVSYTRDGALKFARHTGGESGGGWDTVVVDLNSNGLFSSLAVLTSGNPAIASCNGSLSGELRYAWSDNGGTNSDWHPVVVASGALDGYSCSLAIVQGVPMICFRGGTVDYSDLKFAVGNDANGTSWTVSAVDSGVGNTPDTFTSIAEVDGKPAIVYYNETTSTLRYGMFFREGF